MQQNSRRECVEIAGSPQQREQDTNELVIKVDELMGVRLNKMDISVSHRLPQSPQNESYSSRLRSRARVAASSPNVVNQVP